MSNAVSPSEATLVMGAGADDVDVQEARLLAALFRPAARARFVELGLDAFVVFEQEAPRRLALHLLSGRDWIASADELRCREMMEYLELADVFATPADPKHAEKAESWAVRDIEIEAARLGHQVLADSHAWAASALRQGGSVENVEQELARIRGWVSLGTPKATRGAA